MTRPIELFARQRKQRASAPGLLATLLSIAGCGSDAASDVAPRALAHDARPVASGAPPAAGEAVSPEVSLMLGRARPTGSYALTLPEQLAGSVVEVLHEDRTIDVAGGAFTDAFAAEHTAHIYKITPGAR